MKEFFCEKCKKEFEYKGTLKTHIETCHCVLKPKQNYCHTCKRSFQLSFFSSNVIIHVINLTEFHSLLEKGVCMSL